jgi:UDP-N-acetylmuramate: L-alanyl-gamma-D-glutamyl-meso-diaminopimelate ligase
VGGRVRGRQQGSNLGCGRFFVIEGDEYDSAFYEKWAKFLSYRAHGLILTSIEHDHVDIYPTASQYVRAFEKLVSGMPAAGLVVACADSRQVLDVCERAPCRVVTYGVGADSKADLMAVGIEAVDSGQRFTLAGASGPMGDFFLPMTGTHNVANAVAALAMCIHEARIDPAALVDALADFPGVARRQHVVGTPRGIRVVDDFGHHPTAVKLTIDGLRAGTGPDGRIVAVLRPASATACRSVHQRGWVEALGAADHVILAPLARPDIDPAERLDLEMLSRDLRDAGSEARMAPRLDDIPALVASAARPGDTVVLFSNSDTASVLADVVAALASGKTI